jgi:hypothetical protein
MHVLQIAGAVELQVTCPFVVPFNQASQVQTNPALKHLTDLPVKSPVCLLAQAAWHTILAVYMITNSHCKAQRSLTVSSRLGVPNSALA